jgi:hypothetical protein
MDESHQAAKLDGHPFFLFFMFLLQRFVVFLEKQACDHCRWKRANPTTRRRTCLHQQTVQIIFIFLLHSFFFLFPVGSFHAAPADAQPPSLPAASVPIGTVTFPLAFYSRQHPQNEVVSAVSITPVSLLSLFQALSLYLTLSVTVLCFLCFPEKRRHSQRGRLHCRGFFLRSAYTHSFATASPLPHSHN